MLSAIIQKFDWSAREPRRIFHGRGQGQAPLKTISIDWLPPVVLITLYQEWEELTLRQLIDEFVVCSNDRVSSVVVQRRFSKPAVFETVVGAPVNYLVVEEGDLKYQLAFNPGMHTGLFLDMACARQWLREHAAGKRILNLFAYTCAFSIAGLAGQALSVVNIDMSSRALARGRENHRLNEQDLHRVSFLAHDIFRSWGKLKRQGPYDLVVVDPPAYQPGSFVTENDYARIVRRLPDMLTQGAEVLFCLNDPARGEVYLKEMVETNADELVFQQRLENPKEFADIDSDRALKVLHYKFDPVI
ncbi:MAG: class I SAM-dependent methyltransferase [Pseudomonadales bacterium]|nr:class I SAM-dependent methyltransferase [Pseudomonadales bacterium]